MLDRLGALVAKWTQRAATAPIEFHPPAPYSHGTGLGTQPSHEALLRGSIGVADVATRAIASRIASLNPLVKVARRRAAGTVKDEILDDHVLKRLLDRPHPNLTRSQLFRLTAQWIISTGDGHWLKVGNGLGVPSELHPIPPNRCDPILSGGVVDRFAVKAWDGSTTEIPAEMIVRFYFPDPEAWWRSEGFLGPVGLTADAVKFAAQTLRKHFERDGTPKSVLEAGEGSTAFSPEAQAAFKTLWQQMMNARVGSDVGTPFITPLGYKLVQIPMQSGKDMVPLLEFWRDEQLLAFGTPRSVLGQVVSGDRSSAETNQWVFDKFTVLPIATMMQETLSLQLAPDFDPSIFVEFEPFVSDDKEFELKREAQDIQYGVRTVNKVLEDRGDDPVPWGNQPLMSTKVTVFDPNAKPQAVASPGGGEEPDPDDDAEGEDVETEEEERARIARKRRVARSRRAKRVA